ncbi:sulfur carrier protein ThiS [Planctomycetales bacterium]|nr:sulfur carrier protein ThiS [Planctomycetales bacterium]GHT35826.1 sulfur carrier protein ThiS [Planctomycetales bacterium]
MQLTINNEIKELPDDITVKELLSQLDLAGKFVAVERNLDIVPFKTFDKTVLQNGDSLEIVTLVGGG